MELPGNKILNTAKAWLSLIRFPNLFTVPGDAIFAYLVVNGRPESPNFIYMILSVVSCYIFGLVTNDIVDYGTDMKERPGRPLPAGLISIGAAKFAAFVFGGAGLLSAFLCGPRTFSVALALILVIIGYNCIFKHVRLLGPSALAMCRLLGFAIGLFAAHSNVLSSYVFYPAVFFLLIYVFGFSVSAQVETEEGSKRTVLAGGWIILCCSILWLASGWYISMKVDGISVMGEMTPSICFAACLAAIMLLSTLKNVLKMHLSYRTSAVPPFIGESIRNLIIFQASACAFAGFLNAACIVAILFIPAWILSKIYYQS